MCARPEATPQPGSSHGHGFRWSARWCAKSTRYAFAWSVERGVRTMRTLFDILKKDRKGTFQWLETVKDIETAKARVLQLSSESPEEFVVFRGTDLQVVATSRAMQTNTEVLREFPQQRLQVFAD